MDAWSVDISFGEGVSRHVTFFYGSYWKSICAKVNNGTFFKILRAVITAVFNFFCLMSFLFLSLRSRRVMNVNLSTSRVATVSSKKRANITSKGAAQKERAVHTCTISFWFNSINMCCASFTNPSQVTQLFFRILLFPSLSCTDLPLQVFPH